jgi:hypothetical protein
MSRFTVRTVAALLLLGTLAAAWSPRIALLGHLWKGRAAAPARTDTPAGKPVSHPVS